MDHSHERATTKCAVPVELKQSAILAVLDHITPLIITYNEAPNIERTLEKLIWAKRILIIDSGSTDETIDIAQRYGQVEVITRPFVGFANQCNFGLAKITSSWVLSLDADYELSDDLVAELGSLDLTDGVVGYRAKFIYRIYGRPLRGSLYPPRVILYRSDKAFYRQEGHHHRVVVEGHVESLKGVIYHDDRKPLARWILSQQRYASEEADYLLTEKRLTPVDKLRRAGWAAPIVILLYTLVVKGCMLDGWPGWNYTIQRCIAEWLLALEITDRRLRRGAANLRGPENAG